MTKKWLSIIKKIGKFFLFFVLFLISLYGIIGLYIDTHHDQLLKEVREIANKNIKGEVTIGDFEVVYFHGFPHMTIAVKDVTIKDSLWAKHKRTLLKANSIYAKILPWDIFLKKIKIDNVSIHDAKIHLYIDPKGYTNTSVFSSDSKTKTTSSKKLSLELDQVKLVDVSFISENQFKHKRFDFTVDHLHLKKFDTAQGWEADIDLKTLVKSMTFSMRHGSFAKNKVIEGTLIAKYSEANGAIAVNSDALSIGEDVFKVNTSFGVDKGNSIFSIGLFVKNIRWKSASNLLSNNISRILNRFDFKDPFKVSCNIIGDFNKDGDPKILVKATIKNNELSYFDYKITDCNFLGVYNNHYQKNKDISDENSAVVLQNFRGKVKNIPFVTKNMMILNLDKPIASGSFVSSFDLEQLNQTIVNKEMSFESGNANLNLSFKADVEDLKMVKPFFIGSVVVQNANGTLIPLNKQFQNSSIDLSFTTNQLRVNQIVLNTQKSALNLKGNSDNFLNYYYDSPEKIFMNWDIQAKTIDLNEFNFGSGKTTTAPKQTAAISPDIINILNESNASINFSADTIIYKKVKVQKAIAQIKVVADSTIIKNVSLVFGKSPIKLNGAISYKDKSNHIYTKIDATKVDVDELLKAFDNFGSKALTPESISGLVSISGYFDGDFDKNLNMVKRSLTGNLNLELNKGALKHFDPLKKIGKYAFPFRNFDNITIDSLDINIDIKDGFANFDQTPINSSVLDFDLEGTYGFYGDSNMEVDVHLRNPEKDKKRRKKKIVKEKRNRGITLHLQAIEEGENPFKIKLRFKNEKLKY
ncbi:AsmA-like C-terminal region-containing protein [Flavobacterium succinicans]|uniref:Putative assembly protein n=1 Tax=Flavobacterium succinicans TaxID=29536 RepID=A0A199XU16_9FLAO|nr:AsmA-like C-terminal region-containing protein [Flavobacterium succinicans]OAZ05135.1 putative assembly protein [Flavobacterium succinicans]